MAVLITYHDQQNYYEVNGKVVYLDGNDNWVSRSEEMTAEEKEAFLRHLKLMPIKITPNNLQKKIIEEVKAERIRQNLKFGEQNHYPAEWLMILGEEVGEANKAALETYFKYEGYDVDYSEYRKELIQVAAVAISMIESLDRNSKSQQNGR